MTSREFVEAELIKRNTGEKDIKDILEIFERARSIENSHPVDDKLIVDREKHKIFVDGVQHSNLPRKVFNMIDLFSQNKDVLITRDKLLKSIWPDVFVGERTVDVHIVKVRNIFGKNSIQTVKGMGYKFKGVQ